MNADDLKLIQIKLEPHDVSTLHIVKIEEETFYQNIKIEDEQIQEIYHNFTFQNKTAKRHRKIINGFDVLVEDNLLCINLETKVLVERLENEWNFYSEILNKIKHKRKSKKIIRNFSKVYCDFCKKGMSRASLLIHFQRHHGLTPCYSCPTCKIALRSSTAVKNHQKRYNGECTTNFFPVILRLKTPHINSTSYLCSNCNVLFASQISLRNHRLACVENQSLVKKEIETIKQEPCEDKKDLKKNFCVKKDHTKFKRSAKLFECPDCLYKNRRQSHLKRHYLAIHLKEKRFQCNICQKYFSTNDHLKSHRKIWHTNEGLICDCCGKSFVSKRLLKYHILRTRASQKKPPKYVCCNLCDKYLKSEINLRNHMKLHSGIKKFICEHCEQKFTNRQDLNRHLINEHFKEKLRCSLCISKFSAKHHLKKHLINIHKETNENVLKKVDDIFVDYVKLKFV